MRHSNSDGAAQDTDPTPEAAPRGEHSEAGVALHTPEELDDYIPKADQKEKAHSPNYMVQDVVEQPYTRLVDIVDSRHIRIVAQAGLESWTCTISKDHRLCPPWHRDHAYEPDSKGNPLPFRVQIRQACRRRHGNGRRRHWGFWCHLNAGLD